MTRDFERALTERTKSAFDMLSFKEIDEENVKKIFDIEKDDLFYNVVTQCHEMNSALPILFLLFLY